MCFFKSLLAKTVHPVVKITIDIMIQFAHPTSQNTFKKLPQYTVLNNNYRNKLSIFGFQFDVFIYQLTFKLLQNRQ